MRNKRPASDDTQVAENVSASMINAVLIAVVGVAFAFGACICFVVFGRNLNITRTMTEMAEVHKLLLELDSSQVESVIVFLTQRRLLLLRREQNKMLAFLVGKFAEKVGVDTRSNSLDQFDFSLIAPDDEAVVVTGSCQKYSGAILTIQINKTKRTFDLSWTPSDTETFTCQGATLGDDLLGDLNAMEALCQKK